MSQVFDPNSFNKDTLDFASKAAGHLPSPLKTGLIVGSLGAVVGMLLGKSPVKWGIISGGITFGTTLAADTAFSLGMGMGAASCVDVTKEVFATKGLGVPPGYATSGWEDSWRRHHEMLERERREFRHPWDYSGF